MAVFEAAKKLLSIYPLLEIHVLSYQEGASLKSFIELKGVIEVDYHGEDMFVFMNILLPENFP